MKKIIFILLCMFSFSLVFSQTIIPFPGFYGEITTPPEDHSPYYTVTINITDLSGQFNGTDVDTINFVLWQNCRRYEVDSIVVAFASEVTLYVNDVDGSGSPILGFCSVLQESEKLKTGFYIAGITDGKNQCMASYYEQFYGGFIVDSLLFDSDRPILRVPSVGTNIGGINILQWLEWWYFTAPTMSLNLSPSTTLYEIGDTSYITVSGVTTNSGGAALSNGYLRRTAPDIDTLNSFGSGTSYTFSFSFYPTKDSTSHYKQTSYSFRAKQDWVFGSESGTAQSTSRAINAVYPLLYGVSADTLNLSGDPYAALIKSVTTEGNKTLVLPAGTNVYIYFAIPKEADGGWVDYNLSLIKDHNDFNVTASFTSYDIIITSSGLVNNWTADYKLYKLKTLTTTNGTEDYEIYR